MSDQIDTSTDFSEEEKQHLLDCIESNPDYCHELLAWYESNDSDGYWTEDNIQFVKSLRSAMFIYDQRDEVLFPDDLVDYPQLIICACGEMSKVDCDQFCINLGASTQQLLEDRFEF